VQALSKLEFKSDLPDIRLQYQPPGGKKTGSESGGRETDLLRQQQEQLARERLMGEREPVPFMELQTLGLVAEYERAEGSRQEEGAIEWPLTIQLQSLNQRKISMRYPIGTLVGYGGAQPIAVEDMGDGNWHIGVPGSYGFESRIIETNKGLKEAVDLGDDTKRKEQVDRIEKFTRQVFSRMKFASLYGHLFKKSIESINNLATMYLASVDIGREDMSALLTLPACPEDFGKTLESVGGVKYESERALGKMIVSAWQIFNATGLSEKPELFKDFVAQPGWKANVVVPGNENVFKQWFGDPDSWTPGLVSREGWDPSITARWDGDEDKGEKNTLKEENRIRGSRGPLLQWGDIFVREDSYENPVLYRKAVAEFLGNSETAKKAVDLAWKYFRLFGSADFVGYEWYAKNEKNIKTGKTETQIHAAIPLGSDFTSDLGKIIHPDEYFEFYHKNSRGGLPRGSYAEVTPFAVDALRGINFGDGYILPDGTKLENRPSLHDLLFIYGVPPDKISFNKLSERAIQSPFLRFFMAAKGDEFGKGSFDKTSSKIESPEPFLSPGFWEKLMSDFHVGVTKENVAWVNYIKSYGVQSYKLPGEGEVREYKLEGIRTLLDGIFADEITKKWDSEPDRWSTTVMAKGARGGGAVSSKENKGTFVSQRIIDIANAAIPDLKYPETRIIKVRKRYGIL